MNPTVLGQVTAVLRGRAVPYSRPGSRSAIVKQAIQGAVAVDGNGVAGDEQGDTRLHGGPDKAVHHYPLDHYPAWRDALGALPPLDGPGAFGENISSTGIVESRLCWGDQVRMGSVLLEVAQTRQPCWKLNTRFGVPDMALRVQRTGRTGWYYRVIEPGAVQAGDAITLVGRPNPEWTLARVIEVLYHRPLDVALLNGLAALRLPPSWQRLVAHRLQHGALEDWSARTGGG
ncbi:MOSC domain containing protein [Acidovorax delafieldii 2AN]|uniref:MOSC domain containing protein n=1 Tax=Acidovorax delafieldii 2AN TaxID=573060 RepID=C5T7F9_ACIDE|nr:MOSC domain-containing protein [Acidovorax delafieldii]EER59592.1 MOSC domain containing protein [Acidovorax delafieldii 2AN]